jgi:sugar lactone lactonase YvrE
MKLISFLGVLFLAACGGSSDKKTTEQTDSAKTPELVLKWESDSSLKVPESVLFDKAAQGLYVSNIDGQNPWEADGKGSIGKVGLDGKVIAAEWVSGLHGPKGMGMFNGKLYVADLGNIVVIDIAAGKIEKSIPIAGATGLNDISIDPNGVIYITEYLAKKLYKVENEKAELIAENLTPGREKKHCGYRFRPGYEDCLCTNIL